MCLHSFIIRTSKTYLRLLFLNIRPYFQEILSLQIQGASKQIIKYLDSSGRGNIVKKSSSDPKDRRRDKSLPELMGFFYFCPYGLLDSLISIALHDFFILLRL